MNDLPRRVLDAPVPDLHAPDAGVAAILARSLAVAAPRGPVFAGLDIDVPAGSVAAVVGGARTGKSMLLLALTGRMRPVSGTLLVGGRDGVRHPGQVRAVTAVARVGSVIGPEPMLTLDDCLTERTLFDAAKPRTRLANYLHAARLLDLEADLATLYGDLVPLDRARAALALACVRPSEVIVLDDLHAGLTVDEQGALWAGITALAADGVTVVAATGEPTAVPATALRIDLDRN